MPDDRDHRKVKIPPQNVRAQTSRPRADSWDGDGTPPMGTPVLDVLAVRTRTTQEETKETLLLVADVRKEMHSKVDALAEHVGTLREEMGTVVGTLDGIKNAMQEDRDERKTHSMMRVTAFQADLEIDKNSKLAEIDVEKTQRLAQIDDENKRREHRRAMAYKVVAIIATAATAVSTAIAAGRC